MSRRRRPEETARLVWAGKPGAGLTASPRVTEIDEVVLPRPDPAKSEDYLPTNRLIGGDNLSAMQALLAEGYAGQIDLVYVDPPFGAAESHHQTVTTGGGSTIARPAFVDCWDGLDAYLTTLQPRLQLIHQLLSPRGSLYVHLDWRSVHYVKIALDEIFGRENFRNEIVWRRARTVGRKAAAAQFGRVTDSILYYGKGPEVTFHRPYRRRRADPAGLHWDAEEQRYYKTAPRGDYTDASIAELRQQNRVYETRSGRVRIKYFLDEDGGNWYERMPVDSLWLDVPDLMHSSPAERTGYPTQKPVALLQRIIATSSNPDDLVADFFAGSGTTLIAAERLGRRWIGVEASTAGVQTARHRLIRERSRPFQIERLAAEDEGTATAADWAVRPVATVSPSAGRTAEVAIDLTAGQTGPSDSTPIESWAVDWDYDGRTFRSRWHAVPFGARQAEPLPLAARTMLPTGRSYTVAVRVFDVLGRATTTTIDLRLEAY